MRAPGPGADVNEEAAAVVGLAGIDAHRHVWRPERGDYGWIEPGSALDRVFALEDLFGVPEAAVRSVLVQAAPTEAETRFLLDVARNAPGAVAGVVGWVALDAPDAVERVSAMAREPELVGLRPMLQDLPDREWILRPAVAPALRAMTAHGLVLDLLLRDDQLCRVPELAKRWPELRMVLDHAGKPPVAGGELRRWREDVARCAAVPNLCCKLSGLATEAGAGWDAERLRPVVEELLERFGPARLLWGSDWPVVELAGGYRAWHAATGVLLREVDANGRAAILGGTAARVYGLEG